MKSTAPAFRFLGEFEQKTMDYTIGYYTSELNTAVALMAKATTLAGKISDYAVARNKTKQMGMQYAEIEVAFEAQIEEERKRMKIILTEYEQQLVVQMKTTQRQLELALNHYREEIEKLVMQNNFTLQKLKRRYNIEKQILQPLYKQKEALQKFYRAVQDVKNFEQVNELGDAYAFVVRKIADLEKDLIKG